MTNQLNKEQNLLLEAVKENLLHSISSLNADVSRTIIDIYSHKDFFGEDFLTIQFENPKTKEKIPLLYLLSLMPSDNFFDLTVDIIAKHTDFLKTSGIQFENPAEGTTEKFNIDALLIRLINFKFNVKEEDLNVIFSNLSDRLPKLNNELVSILEQVNAGLNTPEDNQGKSHSPK